MPAPMPIDMEVLRARVRGSVTFSYFTEGSLWYKADDGWCFPVPVSDTGNEQGGSPVFNAVEKGVLLMRWIRREMESQAQTRAEALNESAWSEGA